MSKYQAWILLVFCNLFWAGNYVFGKYIVAEMTPLWITTARWFFALLLLVPLAHFIERPNWRDITRTWWKLLFGMGMLGAVAYNFTLYAALQFTSSTNAAFVQTLNPAMIVILSIVFLRDRINRVQTTGLLLSLFGVLVLLSKGDWQVFVQAEYNRGDLLMLLALTVWSLYSILAKKATAIPPITATAVSTLFSVLILLPFAWVQGIDTSTITSVGVAGLVYIAIFPSVFSYILWNLGIRAIGPSQAGVFMNLIPLFTALISLLLGQMITMAQVLGGLLILIGVYFTSRTRASYKQTTTSSTSSSS